MNQANQTQFGPKERAALQETARLLDGLEVGFGCSDGATGEHVSVAASTLPNGDGTLRLMVSCLALGQQRVRWQGMPIKVIPSDTAVVQETGKRPTYICRLNDRGSGVLSSVQGGEYRLSVPTSARWGWLADSDFLDKFVQRQHRDAGDIERDPLTSSSVSSRAQRLGAAQGEGIDIPDIEQVASNENLIQASLHRTRSGKLAVEFITREADLAGAIIEFAFIYENGLLAHGPWMVALKAISGGLGISKGGWENRVVFQEPCSLFFHVLPSEEALAELVRFLGDADAGIRRTAVQVVGRLGAAAATEVILTELNRLLSDDNESVRGAAAEALQILKSTTT